MVIFYRRTKTQKYRKRLSFLQQRGGEPMRFVECVDYGDAPTIFVSGHAAISLITPHIIQVSLYRSFELPDGTVENRVVLHKIWDRDLWLSAPLAEGEARAAVLHARLVHRRGLGRVIGAH